MAQSVEGEFQQLCRQKHLAATHQRLVIYRAMMQMPSHPNPEQVFERVRAELPSISLATVYKTVHLFVQTGIIREVSPHHGSVRIEPNAQPHHHFVCLQCHAITDLALCEIDEMPLRSSVPEGYHVMQISMEARGLCRQCAAKTRVQA
jgi:Fur family transcriptional regulator, peroxide stress response regulator